MPEKPASKRTLVEGIEASGTFPVEYRFAHAKNGNRHLVVVFANFSAPDDYGWSNGVFDNLRANILWIRDRFDGMNSYYLCRGMDFSLQESVVTLIGNVMRALQLTPDDCTMWGGSKGGSAALYFGLRYGFRNIVSVVPQFRIGTYVQTVHPKVARYMMGEDVTPDKVRYLDEVIPEVVRSGINSRANVYLLSSPQDAQYPAQVEPFLGLFQQYENFNFVFSDSPFITDHTQVTRRNVPALMGLLNFLIDGVAPRIGYVSNGHEEPDRDRSAIESYLSSTSLVKENSFPAPVVLTPRQGGEVHPEGVRVGGTAPGSTRVSLWENGKFLASPPTAPDGSWMWQSPKPLPPGKHMVRLFAVDPAGFHSPRTEVAFTVSESAAPAAVPMYEAGAGAATVPRPGGGNAPSVTFPAPQQQLASRAVMFQGSAPGAAHVGLREAGLVIGAVPVGPDGGWFWESEWAWTPGPHMVEVFATDVFGAESAPTVVVFSAMIAVGAGPHA